MEKQFLLKPLLINFDFPPIVSGISSLFYNLFKELDLAQTIVLAPKLKNDEVIDKNYPLKVLRYSTFFGLKAIRIIALIPYVFTCIVKLRINILICAVPLSLGFIGLLFNKIKKIPYIVFYYGGELDKYRKNPIAFSALKTILRNATRIVTISDYTSDEVSEYGVDKKKVFKIIPGVDFKKFRPSLNCEKIKVQFDLENKRVLLTVARLARRKGIDSVIEALNEVIKEDDNVTYVIVGKGRDENYLKKLVKDKGLEKYVIFAGSVSDFDLPLYYNACDIYVMPNKKTVGGEILEGFGISFVEAAACAKPVIGGITGGVREAVLDGKTGLLVDPNNIKLLSESILKLLRNKDYANDLGQTGRQWVEAEFAWSTRALALKELLETIKT